MVQHRQHARLNYSSFGPFLKDPSVMQRVSRFRSQRVPNLACDLLGWLWVAVIEELWDKSHNRNAKNNPTAVL